MMNKFMQRLKLLFGVVDILSANQDQAQVEGLNGEIFKARHINQYGLSISPLPGSKGFMLSLGGDRAHAMIIRVRDNRHEVNLSPGDVCLFDYRGNKIHLQDGAMAITAVDKLTATAPEIEANATTISATATGKIEASAPQITATAQTKIELTTPVLVVSGVVQAAGYTGAGGGVAKADSGMEVKTLKANETIETPTLTASSDVTAGGVSLKGHTHGGVESGSKTTSPPS